MTQAGTGKLVLFDLDGTLVDTAPDMVGVLQALQRDMGVDPLPYALGRSNVSNGALGLLRLAFADRDINVNDSLMCDYIGRYARQVCDRSLVFPGMSALLDRLDGGQRPWGVVTNKPAHLTEPLMEGLELDGRSACTVSGDTLTNRKPDPAPLLHACEIVGVRPRDAMYIGDADRDVEAGRRAGMMTVAAAYGYITDNDDPRRWGADEIARDTAELTQIVLKAVNLLP